MAKNWQPPPQGGQCWVEIPTTGDVNDLKKFYADLFPLWTFREEPDDLNDKGERKLAHFKDSNGTLDGGIVRISAPVQAQDQPVGMGATVYYLVSNLEEIEAKVHELGGKTCVSKTPEAENCFYMNFYDPVGNRFGAFQFGA